MLDQVHAFTAAVNNCHYSMTIDCFKLQFFCWPLDADSLLIRPQKKDVRPHKYVMNDHSGWVVRTVASKKGSKCGPGSPVCPHKPKLWMFRPTGDCKLNLVVIVTVCVCLVMDRWHDQDEFTTSTLLALGYKIRKKKMKRRWREVRFVWSACISPRFISTA